MAHERKIRIRLFGTFQAWTAKGTPASLPTKHAAEVLALLASRDGRAVRRSELAEAVWGSADDRSKASLRNALSSIRRTLGDPRSLVTDRELARLDTTLCTSDVGDVERLLRKANLVTKTNMLQDTVRRVDVILDSEFLSGWDADWVLGPRAYWEAQREEAWSMLGEALENDGLYEEALSVAKEALKRQPWNEVAAGRAMRCAAEMGELHVAQEIFNQHESSLRESEVSAASAVLVRMAEVIGKGDYPRHSDRRDFEDPSEQDAIVRAFEESLQHGGDEALKFVASNTNYWVHTRNPSAALSVMEKCLAAAHDPSEARCRVAFAASFLAQLLADYRRAETHLLLAQEDAERLASDTLILQTAARLGFYYLEVRDPASARRAFSRGTEVIDRVHDPWVQAQFKINYAGLVWHEGDSDQAIALYRSIQTLPPLARLDHHRSVALANLSMLYGEEEEWEAAVRSGEEAVRVARALGNHYVEAASLIGLGVGHAGLGDRTEVGRTLTDALGIMQRRSYRRLVVIGLDKVAIMWTVVGRPDLAGWAFRAGETLRERIGHPRSTVEKRLAARYRPKMSAPEACGKSLRRTSFDSVVQQTCDHLALLL
ncbi:MAG: winged helix-turn-helix domain-containing protein [Fimbriimonadaceae bacterium]|nr:winged helix-turn-helix domain-containing protein [Fimbriimonadaceae bacterium]